MTRVDQTSKTRDIVVEDDLPHAPEIVWKTLTNKELLSRWLMPNDFQPVVGKRFTFQTKPMETGMASCIAKCSRS